jgi:hypothetical protein
MGSCPEKGPLLSPQAAGFVLEAAFRPFGAWIYSPANLLISLDREK